MNQRNTSQGYNLLNPDYIKANRRGQVTAEQRAVMESQLALVPSLMGLGCQIFLWVVVLGVFGLIGIITLSTLSISIYLKIGFAVLVLILIAGVLLTSGYRYFNKRAVLRAELENVIIRRAEGEIVFGKKGYRVQAGGQELDMPWFASQERLTPGMNYIFYYLPQSALILSAETHTLLGERQAQGELNEILAKANKFHLSALGLNRQGQLAEEQMSRLRSNLFAPLLLLLLPLGFLGYQVYKQFSENSRIIFNNGFIIMGLIAVAMMVFGVISLTKSLADITQKRVIFVEGPGQKEEHTQRDDDGTDSTNYYYRIGGERFSVDRTAYMALIDGLRYRAYFTPGRKTLINIEALESPYQEN